jgi:FkbM family methyltransferase
MFVGLKYRVFNHLRFLLFNMYYVENWVEVLLYFVNMKSGIEIRYKNSYRLILYRTVPHEVSVHYFILKLVNVGCSFEENQVSFKDDFIFKIDPNDLSSYSHIFQTFFDNEYAKLNVQGKIVGDVGASLGDTAIYFAKKGAKKVYSYEPQKKQYDLMVENIALNNLEHMIYPYNVAVQAKPGQVYITNVEEWSGASKTSYSEEGKGSWIDAVTLSPEIEVLKMDCEGCEFDVLNNIELKKTNIQEIILEYHNNLDKLETIIQKQNLEYCILEKHSDRGILYIKIRTPHQRAQK